MAGDEEQQLDAAELVRDVLRRVGKLLVWVVPIGALCWLLWSIFSPEKVGQHETADDFLRSYAAFAAPFAKNPDLTPMPRDVSQWLKFFDDDSEDFFRQNTGRIVLRATGGDPQSLAGREKGQLEIEAMREAMNVAPLNGVFGVVRATQRKDGEGADVEIDAGRRRIAVFVRRTPGGWRITEMMGVRDRLVTSGESRVRD